MQTQDLNKVLLISGGPEHQGCQCVDHIKDWDMAEGLILHKTFFCLFMQTTTNSAFNAVQLALGDYQCGCSNFA